MFVVLGVVGGLSNGGVGALAHRPRARRGLYSGEIRLAVPRGVRVIDGGTLLREDPPCLLDAVHLDCSRPFYSRGSTPPSYHRS